MPNMMFNTITVEGENGLLEAFLGAVKGENGVFDFNSIIAMPEILKHTGTGGIKIDGVVYGSWYIEEVGGHEVARTFTQEECLLLRRIGYSNWYDWALSHWGTKWNAMNATVVQSNGRVRVFFETAWDPPYPVLDRLVEMFPDLVFDFDWEAEGEDEEDEEDEGEDL